MATTTNMLIHKRKVSLNRWLDERFAENVIHDARNAQVMVFTSKFVRNVRDTNAANNVKTNALPITMPMKRIENVFLVIRNVVVAVDLVPIIVSNVVIGKYTKANQASIQPHSIAPQIAPLTSFTEFIHLNSNHTAVMCPHMLKIHQVRAQERPCI